jgi:hypothetical protein
MAKAIANAAVTPATFHPPAACTTAELSWVLVVPFAEAAEAVDVPVDSAPAEPVVDVTNRLEVPDEELAAALVSPTVVAAAVVPATATDDEVVDAAADPDEDPALVSTVPPALGGGGTTLDWSTSLPTPQGVGAAPLGCTELAGGVVSPLSEAIVKRVVQVLLLTAVVEYW